MATSKECDALSHTGHWPLPVVPLPRRITAGCQRSISLTFHDGLKILLASLYHWLWKQSPKWENLTGWGVSVPFRHLGSIVWPYFLPTGEIWTLKTAQFSIQGRGFWCWGAEYLQHSTLQVSEFHFLRETIPDLGNSIWFPHLMLPSNPVLSFGGLPHF